MHESIVQIISSIAAGSSLTISLFSLPRQIWANYKNDECRVDKALVYAATLTYPLWAIYGWIKPDLFLKICQTPGSILAWVLVYQARCYPRRAKKE